jgi:hypothetical protein
MHSSMPHINVPSQSPLQCGIVVGLQVGTLKSACYEMFHMKAYMTFRFLCNQI